MATGSVGPPDIAFARIELPVPEDTNTPSPPVKDMKFLVLFEEPPIRLFEELISTPA